MDYLKNMMNWDQVLQLLLNSDAVLQTLKDQCGPAAYMAAINQKHVAPEWEEVESFLMEAFEDSAQASLIWSGYTYDPNYPEDVDRKFPVNITKFCGFYRLYMMEMESIYFMELSNAREYLGMEYDYLQGIGRLDAIINERLNIQDSGA